MKKEFDKDKFQKWVEQQGGWEAVYNRIASNPLFVPSDCQSYIPDACISGMDPLEIRSMRTPSFAFWCVIADEYKISVRDFLKAEVVDARTAMKILSGGGEVYIGGGMKIEFIAGHGVGYICPEGDFYPEHIDDCKYQVVSWGDYPHE